LVRRASEANDGESDAYAGPHRADVDP
jgi:hypothetical protein